jgi:hypothetical protein
MSGSAQLPATAGMMGPKGKPWAEAEPYVYPINVPAMTTGQQGVQAQLQLDTDFDFWWDRILALSSQQFSVSLTDSSRGVPLIGNGVAPINGENFGGIVTVIAVNSTQLVPFWLSKPYRLAKGSFLQATFNNRTPFGNTIQFCLVGRKAGS